MEDDHDKAEDAPLTPEPLHPTPARPVKPMKKSFRVRKPKRSARYRPRALLPRRTPPDDNEQ